MYTIKRLLYKNRTLKLLAVDPQIVHERGTFTAKVTFGDKAGLRNGKGGRS